MVVHVVRAHPETPGSLPGREQALGRPGEVWELPGEAGMDQTLDGRHAPVLDGAPLEHRRQRLERQGIDERRVSL